MNINNNYYDVELYGGHDERSFFSSTVDSFTSKK